MRQGWRTVAIRIGLLLVLTVAGPTWAQKPGGVLKIQHWDSPASMSIHEEATYSVVVPMMGVMNNLVMYKQDVPAEQPAIDCSRSRRKLVVERRRHAADLQIAGRG